MLQPCVKEFKCAELKKGERSVHYNGIREKRMTRAEKAAKYQPETCYAPHKKIRSLNARSIHRKRKRAPIRWARFYPQPPFSFSRYHAHGTATQNRNTKTRGKKKKPRRGKKREEAGGGGGSARNKENCRMSKLFLPCISCLEEQKAIASPRAKRAFKLCLCCCTGGKGRMRIWQAGQSDNSS